MEVKCKVSLAFIKWAVDKKITFGEKTASCLEVEIDKYPNLPYPLVDVKKINDKLLEDEKEAMSGDKVAIERRDSTVLEWNEVFRQTANYVSLITKGNLEMIKSTNFQPTKSTRQRQPKIAEVDNFKTRIENEKGAASASCQSAKGARGYAFIAMSQGVRMGRVGDDLLFEFGTEQVRVKLCTVNKAFFAGLPSEQRAIFSSVVFNAAGCSATCDTQSLIIQ